MTMKRVLGGAALAVLLIFLWAAWPIYGFFSHSGEAPLPPFGWLDNQPGQVVFEASDEYDFVAQANDALIAERERIDTPALAAAVAIDGNVVWAGAAGWADIKSQSPATPETRFRIGSTSKAITATALARLVDQAVIDLDTPITDYIGDMPNPDWSTITPRMLASHMSGVPHYGYNGDSDGLYPFTALNQHYDAMADAVKLFDEADLLFAPGDGFEYSSLGTVLLGHVMSAAAGKPYLEIVREEVLGPAGMSDTIVAPMHPSAEDALATFYYRGAKRFRPWRPVDLSHRLPGGGFASTPSDLVKMGMKWLDDDYISPEIRAAFWTPQKLNSGETNEQDYAIGFRWREFEVDEIGVVRNANHGGVSRGSQFWFMILPDRNASIALAMNAKTDMFWDFGGAYEEILKPFVDSETVDPSTSEGNER